MNDYEEEKQAETGTINLMDYWAVLMKRKWTVLAFAIPLFIVVTILSFVIKPTYTAKGTLLIEKEPNILTFEDIFQIESFNDDYFQTQYKLLQSRSLADNVIEAQRLFENENFVGKLRKNSDSGGSGKSDPKFWSKLIDGFLRKVNVKPIRQTRLVEVSFKDHDPKFAAGTLNALFDSFIDMNIQMKYEATAQATEFLTGQIVSIGGEIEKDEQVMQQYGADKNIIALSDKETTIIEKLGELNRALTEAQIDRVNMETYYNSIKSVTPEFIPQALANPLIQRLKEDYGKLSREYLKMQDRFKSDYPELQRLKTELESAKMSLENETQNLQKGAYSDWQAALRKEKSLEAVFNAQKQEAIQLNNNAISYNQLKIEIDNKKSLLENLLKRQSETGVSARLKGLRTSNIRVVDRAEAPLYPSSPKKKLNMALAALIGLLGGVGLAFLFEHLDDSVKNFEDVEKYSGLPALGVVPAFSSDGFEKGYRYGYKIKIGKGERGEDWKKEKERRKDKEKKGRDLGSLLREAGKKDNGPDAGGGRSDTIPSIDLITFVSPKSNISESYRTIRTSLLLSSAEPRPKCIAVSSALPQEGKTATLSNLAVTLAQAGKKVLVVDSDLRKPQQHRIFKVRNLKGLTNYLTGHADLRELIKTTQIPDLFLINAGPVPPNPMELLGSDKMDGLIKDLRQNFDYVLFDTPPILAVTDALALGSKLDGIILIVWGEKTSREALKRAKEKLNMVGIKILGVVLNNIVIRKHDYHYRHGYYRYYGEQP